MHVHNVAGERWKSLEAILPGDLTSAVGQAILIAYQNRADNLEDYMAREISNDEEQTAAATEAENQEASTTEASDGSAEDTNSPAETTEETEKVDPAVLQAAFETAVDEALLHEGRDEDTGTMPEAAFAEVRVAYAALNTRGKTAARDHLQERITAAMIGDGVSQDFAAARSLLEIMNALKQAAPRQTIARQPVDPTEAHIARVAALMLSPNLVPVPADVASDWQTKLSAKVSELGSQVIAYRDWQAANADKATEEQTPAPEVDDIVLAAAQAARGRSASVRKSGSSAPRAPRATSAGSGGPRRNIAAHIESAFAGLTSGQFLSIGEIVNHKSDEYGDEKPSQGAVAARLFPGGDPAKCNVAGIRAEQRDKKGAVKL